MIDTDVKNKKFDLKIIGLIILILWFASVPLGNKTGYELLSGQRATIICSVLFIVYALSHLLVSKKRKTSSVKNFKTQLFTLFVLILSLTSTLRFFLDSPDKTLHPFNYFTVVIFAVFSFTLYIQWLKDEKIIAVLFCVYTLVFLFLFSMFANDAIQANGFSRTTGQFENPNELAAYALFGVLASNYVLIKSKERFIKVFSQISVVIQLFIMFSTESRSALVALAVVIAMSIAVDFRRNLFLLACSLLVFIAFVLFSTHTLELYAITPGEKNYTMHEKLGSSLANNLESKDLIFDNEKIYVSQEHGLFSARIISGETTKEGTIGNNLRFEIWHEYLKNYKSYFLLGSSPDYLIQTKNGNRYYTHNTFLQIFVRYGIFALLTFLAFIFVLFLRAYFDIKKTKSNIVYYQLYVAFLIWSLFKDFMALPYFWISIGITFIPFITGRISNENSNKNESVFAFYRRSHESIGGIEKQILLFQVGLGEKHTSTLLITDNISRLSELFLQQNGEVYYLKHKSTILRMFEIFYLVSKKNISCVQSHMFKEYVSTLLASALVSDVNFIFRVHTYINNSHISMTKKKLYHLLSKFISTYYSHILPINENNKVELLNSTKIDPYKIHVIHDASPNNMTPINYLHRRKKFLKIRQQPIKLVMIANLINKKGHDIAIEAVKALIDNGYKITLDIYGSIPSQTNRNYAYYLELIKLMLSKELERFIKFKGFDNDSIEYLYQYDALILPSYAEGTPNCILEAFVRYTPVIATPVGGIPEILFNNVTGFLMDNVSAKSLENEIVKYTMFSSEDLLQMLINAHALWMREYSEEVVLREWYRYVSS